MARTGGFGLLLREPSVNLSLGPEAWALQGAWAMILCLVLDLVLVPCTRPAPSRHDQVHHTPGTPAMAGATSAARHALDWSKRVLWALNGPSLLLDWTHIDFWDGLSDFWLRSKARVARIS